MAADTFFEKSRTARVATSYNRVPVTWCSSLDIIVCTVQRRAWHTLLQLNHFYVIIHTANIPTINTSTKNVLNKIQFMKNINLLHVSAPGCHAMPSSGSLDIRGTPMLGLYSFTRRDSPKMAWHRGAETCSRLIFVKNCILLRAFVGWAEPSIFKIAKQC